MSQTAVLEEVELSRISSIADGPSIPQTRQASQDELGVGHDPDYRQTNVTAELPPMDKGFHAYAFLAGGFMLELLVWALPFTYGVFLNHYTTHHLFDGPQEFLLPLVGTLSSGIIYLTSIVIMPMLVRYPHQRRNMMWLGTFLCVVALLGAAFATQVWHLILTQGIIYSVGGTIVYFPMQIYVFEWFNKRRGLANGVIFSGTGLGGVILPFIVEKLLEKYGLRTTFLSLAVGYAVLLSASLPFVKGRLPPSSIIIPQKTDWSFLGNPQFVVLFAGNFLQGLGNFVPGIWLPTFASDMNLSVTAGTLVVSLMNAAAVPGSIVIGFASDKYDLRAVMVASMLGSSLAVLILWGLASNLGVLLVFALTYGFLAGGMLTNYQPPAISASKSSNYQAFHPLTRPYRWLEIGHCPARNGRWMTRPYHRHQPATVFVMYACEHFSFSALWPKFSSTVAKDDPHTIARLMSIFLAGRGVGNVLAAPISSSLLRSNLSHGKYAYGLKNYGPLIIFTGVMLFASTVGIFYRNADKLMRRTLRRGVHEDSR